MTMTMMAHQLGSSKLLQYVPPCGAQTFTNNYLVKLVKMFISLAWMRTRTRRSKMRTRTRTRRSKMRTRTRMMRIKMRMRMLKMPTWVNLLQCS